MSKGEGYKRLSGGQLSIARVAKQVVVVGNKNGTLLYCAIDINSKLQPQTKERVPAPCFPNSFLTSFIFVTIPVTHSTNPTSIKGNPCFSHRLRICGVVKGKYSLDIVGNKW